MAKVLLNKVDEAIDLLRAGERLALSMNPEDGYYLAFSGGKDSQVLYDLAVHAGVKFKAWYSVTGNDAPDNVYFIRENYPGVSFVHPKEKFIKLVEKKGMPTINRRFCCDRLKERIGAGNVVLTGVRAEESRKRAGYAQVMIHSRRVEHQGTDQGRNVSWLEQTEHQCIKGKDRVMVHPLLEFTAEDIWNYIDMRRLPINPLYEKCGRVGCMFCPFTSDAQLDFYEKRYPLFKKSILAALEKNLTRRKQSPFRNAAQLYRWWRSKKTVEKFLSEENMLAYASNKS